jgi:hypothetical protein
MDPENHTIRLLIEMRAEMAATRAEITATRAEVTATREEMRERFETVDARFDAMDRRMDVLEDIGRDTAARVRMQGRMLRNFDASKRKHADRIGALEQRVDALERKDG